MLGASYSSASSNSLRLVSGEGKPSGAGPPDPRRLATPNVLAWHNGGVAEVAGDGPRIGRLGLQRGST